MKKRNRFRNYLSLEALVIFLVLATFQLIADKQKASLITSLLFLGSTLGILYWETRFQGFQKRPSFWGSLVFLIFSVLPILILRLVYWGTSFNEIQMGSMMTGAKLHQSSNYVFMLMMICFFIDAHLERVKEKEAEKLY